MSSLDDDLEFYDAVRRYEISMSPKAALEMAKADRDAILSHGDLNSIMDEIVEAAMSVIEWVDSLPFVEEDPEYASVVSRLEVALEKYRQVQP